MRALHIWDTCSIGTLLKHQLEGVVDITVVQPPRVDVFNQSNGLIHLNDNRLIAFTQICKLANGNDIIHIHEKDKLLVPLKLLYPRKRFVMHYHGSDIRYKWAEKKRIWGKADLILYSTVDLKDGAPSHAIMFPTPVNTEMFPKGEVGNGAICFARDKALYEAGNIAEKYNLKLTVITKRLPYTDMPNLLRKHRYYIHVKRDSMGKMLTAPGSTGSVTSLEALSLGLTVLTPFEVRYGLPIEHTPEVAASKLQRLYEEVMR